ncbi:MAG: AAA family ATPase [Planctomycetes bacterium]|nr:AAA family ATPase [Planctomycetota bacterium]
MKRDANDAVRELGPEGAAREFDAKLAASPELADVPPPDPPPGALLTPGDLFDDPTFWRASEPITSTYHALDAMLAGGWRRRYMYALLAAHKSFKSTLLQNIARRSALNGVPVLHVSAEEPPEVAVKRMTAASAHVDYLPLIDGRVHPADVARVRDAVRLLRGAPLHLTGRRGLDDVEELARIWAARYAGALLIVDHLSILTVPDTASEYEAVTAASERLRALAAALNIAILVAVQANRSGAAKPDGPDENDVRASGRVVQDAAALLILKRPAVSDGQALLGVRQKFHRFGPGDDEADLELFAAQGRVESIRGVTP